ncbi:hypothetical protein ACFWBN_02195 [Streptomyces sp. NPDC059989]|uniref:hypothetical protein n=1 Tax=Streptomyces sp. NPDC059989 TaxID=3347026 RepID=UPI00369330B6
MDLLTAASLGATGGAVIEAVQFWMNVSAWRAARRQAREEKRRTQPRFSRFIDPGPDALAFLTRLALGAAAGALLRNQVVGELAAVMVGASAPVLLLQFGSGRSIGHATQFAPPPAEPVPGAGQGGQP